MTNEEFKAERAKIEADNARNMREAKEEYDRDHKPIRERYDRKLAETRAEYGRRMKELNTRRGHSPMSRLI